MDEKIRRLINWSKGEKEPPFEIQANPTNRCNLTCLFCRPKKYAKVEEKDVLPLNRWLELIKEASELGVKHWNILRGEPFTEPEKTLKIMETIKKEGMQGITTTNGTLITKPAIKKIMKIGWDEIIFSLDSSNAETHDYLRDKKGVHERCINTIKSVQDHKKIENKELPRLQLFFVITNKNYKEMPSMIELASSLNIKRVYFQVMVEKYPANKSLKLNKEDLEEFQNYIKETEKISKEKEITTNITSFDKYLLIENSNNAYKTIKNEKDKVLIPCLEPFYMMQISPEGYAGPCCALDNKKINVKNKSIKEIWYGPCFENFRKRIASWHLDKKCSTCCSGQILRNIELMGELKKYTSDFKTKKLKLLEYIPLALENLRWKA